LSTICLHLTRRIVGVVVVVVFVVVVVVVVVGIVCIGCFFNLETLSHLDLGNPWRCRGSIAVLYGIGLGPRNLDIFMAQVIVVGW